MKVKTRFAPSPTGYLHVGSIRTALYSWLFARKYGGNFILRIEDTDYERSTNKIIESIIESMNWLRLDWDEGPYIQTDRFDRYHIVINEMLKIGTAYKCYCSRERLTFLREEQIKRREKPRYDRYCFYRYKKHHYNDIDKPYVVRFANPQQGSVIFNDQIRGEIKFNNEELDDLIILRTDGSPTYNFCVVVDDWDMKITHVIRGEDHINNTPRQINLLKALKAPIPTYAHVSMIYGNDGKKLSKRHNAMNVMQYRNEGFLPEALLNYLVRLGWSSGGNKEIFSREEMIKLFSLKMVSKSASFFDINKLLWLNHFYINSLPKEYIANHLKWYIEQENINICHGPQLSELVELFSKRYKTLKEIAKNCRYLYEEFSEFDMNIAKKYLHSASYQILKMVHDRFIEIDNWTIEKIDDAIQKTANELDIQMNMVGMPLRIAVTGIKQSPPLHLIIHAIGKNRSLIRINRALNFISKLSNNKKEITSL